MTGEPDTAGSVEDIKNMLAKLCHLGTPRQWQASGEPRKNLWSTLESSITAILVLVPEILHKDASQQEAVAHAQLIAVMNGAATLSSLIRTLMTTVMAYSHAVAPFPAMVGSIQTETDAFLGQVRRVEHLVRGQNPHNNTPAYRQLIHRSLIIHAHQLVNMLLAISTLPLFVAVEKNLVGHNTAATSFDSHRSVSPANAKGRPDHKLDTVNQSGAPSIANESKAETASKRFFRNIAFLKPASLMATKYDSQCTPPDRPYDSDNISLLSSKNGFSKNAFKNGATGLKYLFGNRRLECEQPIAPPYDTTKQAGSVAGGHAAQWNEANHLPIKRESGGNVACQDVDTWSDIKKRREPEMDAVDSYDTGPVPPPKDTWWKKSSKDDSPDDDTESFHARRRQRSSVQMLVSPSSRNTYIRMTNKEDGRYVVSSPSEDSLSSTEPVSVPVEPPVHHALPTPPPTAPPILLTTQDGQSLHVGNDCSSISSCESAEESSHDPFPGRGQDSCYSSASSSQAALDKIHPPSKPQLTVQTGSLGTRTDGGCRSQQPNTSSSLSDAYPQHRRPSTPTRSQTSLASIQTEHAAPTFISSTSDVRQKNQLLSVQTREGLKHYRSESDLNRLRNMFPAKKPPSALPSTGSNPSVPGLMALMPHRSNSVHNHGPQGPKNARGKAKENEQGSWNILKTIKRNQSSQSLKKTMHEEVLRQAGPGVRVIDQRVNQAGCDGSILHVSENGSDVLVMEMVSGKLNVLAGTADKLFIKLADEAAQDLDYVDAYIMNHLSFTTSEEFLENLMARFHLEALPGEAEYFKKWQQSIQIKVLNVILRWIKLQYNDFKKAPVLQTRLEAFLNGDTKRAGFHAEANMIKEALEVQMACYARRRHSLVVLTSQSHVPFGNNHSTTSLSFSPWSSPTPSPLTSPPLQQRSAAPSLLSFVSSTPPSSPTSLLTSSQTLSYNPVGSSILLCLEAKDIARYLTLADFYIFKCVTAYDYLNGGAPLPAKKDKGEDDYIEMMTRRANKISHWVVHELLSIKPLKQRRNALRKLIEIAKLCIEWNNFNTGMVITMGLANHSVQKLEETWHALSNRDMNAYQGLQKYLSVSNNMGYYRQALNKRSKAPTIPFFPLVLKDVTFYRDGNPTRLADGALVNFAKFQRLSQFVQGVLRYTSENYWFAGELEHLPFFECASTRLLGPLDHVAEMVEQSIRVVSSCSNDQQCKVKVFRDAIYPTCS